MRTTGLVNMGWEKREPGNEASTPSLVPRPYLQISCILLIQGRYQVRVVLYQTHKVFEGLNTRLYGVF